MVAFCCILAAGILSFSRGTMTAMIAGNALMVIIAFLLPRLNHRLLFVMILLLLGGAIMAVAISLDDENLTSNSSESQAEEPVMPESQTNKPPLLAVTTRDALQNSNQPSPTESSVESYLDESEALLGVALKNIRKEIRIPAWKATLQMIKAHPWVGIGLGNYRHVFPSYKFENIPWPIHYAHNDYLELIAERGIPFFILWLIGVVWLIHYALKILSNSQPGRMHWLRLGLLGAFFSMGIHEVVDFNLALPANHFLFMILLGIFVSLLQKKGAPVYVLNLSTIQLLKAPSMVPNYKRLQCLSILALIILLLGFGLKMASYNWFQQGLELATAGNFEAAQKKLSWAHTLNPTRQEYGYHLGKILMQKGLASPAGSIRDKDFSAANLVLQAAMKRNPLDIDVLIGLGALAYHQQNLAQAKKYFEQVLEINPYNVNYRVYIAEFYYQIGDIGRALLYYRQAIAYKPSSFNRIFSGLYPRLHGNYDLMAAVIPEDVECFQRFIRFLQAKDDDPSLVLAIEHLLEIKEDVDYRYAIKLARAYTEIKAPEKARIVLKKATEVFATNPEALAKIGYVYMSDLRDYKTARAVFEKGIALNPEYLENFYFLITLLRWEGQHDAARQQTLELIKTHSNNAHLYFKLSETYNGMAMWSQAIKAINTAMELDIKNVYYRIYAANLYSKQNMSHAALRVLNDGLFFCKAEDAEKLKKFIAKIEVAQHATDK
jgi:tetratricopeptide (TPR) repeat protein